MIITTTYRTNAKGTGQIVAKSMGKQKTTRYESGITKERNHGYAAGNLVLANAADSIMSWGISKNDVLNARHDSNESGTVHKFYIGE